MPKHTLLEFYLSGTEMSWKLCIMFLFPGNDLSICQCMHAFFATTKTNGQWLTLFFFFTFQFELLFCVHDKSDPAIKVVEGLKEKYPTVDARLLLSKCLHSHKFNLIPRNLLVLAVIERSLQFSTLEFPISDPSSWYTYLLFDSKNRIGQILKDGEPPSCASDLTLLRKLTPGKFRPV
jgi:hypothetical protein